jgi:hypothetical protein
MSLGEVLSKAWQDPFFCKGDFARSHAVEVAMAASAGLITTQYERDTFGRQWLITQKGLGVLCEQEATEA